MSDEFGFDFNASEHETDDGFTPIPGGVYPAKCEKAELKPTKDGTGKRLSLQWRIFGPQYENRVIFHSMNIINKSEAAQKIGQEELARLMNVLGIKTAQGGSVFVGHTANIRVGIQAANGEYDASNVIKGYKAFDGAMAAPAAASGGSKLDWV